MNDYILVHHGIEGQKWGVRRFQNEDGSLTAEGKERYGEKGFKNINKAIKAYNKTAKKAAQYFGASKSAEMKQLERTERAQDLEQKGDNPKSVRAIQDKARIAETNANIARNTAENLLKKNQQAANFINDYGKVKIKELTKTTSGSYSDFNTEYYQGFITSVKYSKIKKAKTGEIGKLDKSALSVKNIYGMKNSYVYV